jgi:hypothetical protein
VSNKVLIPTTSIVFLSIRRILRGVKRRELILAITFLLKKEKNISLVSKSYYNLETT